MPLAREQRVRLARVMAWSRAHGWKHDVYPNTWRSDDGETHVRFDSERDELVVDRLTLGAEPLRCHVALVPVDSPELAINVLAALGHIPMSLTSDYGYGRVDAGDGLTTPCAGDCGNADPHDAHLSADWNGEHWVPRAVTHAHGQHGMHAHTGPDYAAHQRPIDGERIGAADRDKDWTEAAYRALMAGGRHAYMSTYCQHGLHDDCRRTCKCCGAPCVCSACLHTLPEPIEVRCLKRYGHEDHQPHQWQRSDEWVQCLGWPLLSAITSDDDPDAFDGPASFLDAGQAFADLVDGVVEPSRAAEVLSTLAHQGLIVSTAYHDEATGGGSVALLDDLADIFRDQQ